MDAKTAQLVAVREGVHVVVAGAIEQDGGHYKVSIAAIDPATDKVVWLRPVQGCKGNHGMALDVRRRRAFLACEGNSRLAAFDLVTLKTIATMPLPPGPDVVQFDPGLGRIYVACSSGAISVFQEDDPDHFRKLADVPVQRRVHSLAVDVRTHPVYANRRRMGVGLLGC
jgi:DNA-binding beta-propeller fold protein YncE